MDRKDLAEAVKQAARTAKADLVGIAGIDRFAGVPATEHPGTIFPECRSVVVLGRRILRGALRGVEEGTNFSSTYGTFGYTWLEDNFLAQTTYDVTCWLETQGFEAVPLFGYPQEGMPHGRPVAPGKPAPNVIVDVNYAAQAAGLGEPGAGGFFLTPRFGLRQRLAMILTDAEPAADAVFTDEICSDCGACFRACPLGAIQVDRRKSVGVAGARREVAVVDHEICGQCQNGAMRAPGRGAAVDRLAAACGRACTVRLEEAGKCGNHFMQPFRKRTPWALDVFRRPVDLAAGGTSGDSGCGRVLDTIGQR
ncbi:MAG: 4Fe-4S binding protein [Lentisphaeria bacterium]|jgi:epoxyqueuosine reductase QueG|nr:4Fe-4S binding protein [Lentisphaeria bacterium]